MSACERACGAGGAAYEVAQLPELHTASRNYDSEPSIHVMLKGYANLDFHAKCLPLTISLFHFFVEYFVVCVRIAIPRRARSLKMKHYVMIIKQDRKA